ncbi:MAG: O-Antigen ligase [bacterium ADurb.Bin236]|nr:MAG: O-Antigen ligase [bacterium ADurb.Bin236]HOY62363.1 O-antigen ligase family protein [bacterium]HPN94279.1 O-antigen ligase family protein [bacterium]
MNAQSRDMVSPRHAFILAAIIVASVVLNSLFGFIDPETSLKVSKFVVGSYYAGGAILTLIAILNFELAVLILIFLAPLAGYTLPGLKFFFTLSDMYLVILVFLMFVRSNLRRERGVPSTHLNRIIFIFVALTVLSMINSRDMSSGFANLAQTLEFFVFAYFLIVVAVYKRGVLDAIIYAIVIVSALVSIQGILQYFQLGGGDTRIFGALGHFNATGSYLAMNLVFTFNLALAQKDLKTKYFYYAIIILNTAALLMTFSRGAWIATILGIVLSAQIRGMIQFIRAFALIVVAITVLAVAAPPRYIGRLYSAPRVADEASLSRLRQYEIATDTISTYPLLGVGLGSNLEYVTLVYNEPHNSEIHNLFLHIGSERGVPAMIALCAIFVSFFVNIVRRIGRTTDPFFYSFYIALFAAVVAFATVNMFAYQLIRGLGIPFAIFLALFPAATYIEDNTPAETEWAGMLSSLDLKRHHIEMGI